MHAGEAADENLCELFKVHRTKSNLSVQGSTSDEGTLRFTTQLPSHHDIAALRMVSNYAGRQLQSSLQTIYSGRQQFRSGIIPSMSILGN